MPFSSPKAGIFFLHNNMVCLEDGLRAFSSPKAGIFFLRTERYLAVLLRVVWLFSSPKAGIFFLLPKFVSYCRETVFSSPKAGIFFLLFFERIKLNITVNGFSSPKAGIFFLLSYVRRHGLITGKWSFRPLKRGSFFY